MPVVLHWIATLLPFFLLAALVAADPRRALENCHPRAGDVDLGLDLSGSDAAHDLARNEGAASFARMDRSPFGGRGNWDHADLTRREGAVCGSCTNRFISCPSLSGGFRWLWPGRLESITQERKTT